MLGSGMAADTNLGHDCELDAMAPLTDLLNVPNFTQPGFHVKMNLRQK